MTPRVSCTKNGVRSPERDLLSYLTPDLREAARVDANRWIKRLRLVRYGGETMRDRFRYRGDSLWWFTELYLHKMRRVDRAISAVLALEVVCDAESPSRIDVAGADDATAAAARAFGLARRVEIVVDRAPATASTASRDSLIFGVTTRLSRLRPGRSHRPTGRARVAAFVHTAFWRRAPATGGAAASGEEGYIGPVLNALAGELPAADLALVGVGPRRNFRARRWWDPVAMPDGPALPITPVERYAPFASIRESLGLWRARRDLARAVVTGGDVRAAADFHGCDLWPVLRCDLEEAALLQWPWSVRAMDEAAAALDALQPEVVVTYAEAGGWGRALVLEARRRGVRSVGVQHGFIHRHWLNYLHEADEMQPSGADRGFPLPDRTLLFDRYAAEHLEHAGHFPANALAVTGNARLEALVAQAASLTGEDRAHAALWAGTVPGERVALLAAKFTEIRHVLPALVSAATAVSNAHVTIKAHPAETADVYTPYLSGAANLTVAPADADLGRLLAVSDGVITMNSTVAIDALTLGVPSLVVGLPNNLSPFVEAGVMIGAGESAASIEAGLRALLYDQDARQRLLARADAFLDRYQMRPAGHAAGRAARLILDDTRQAAHRT